MPPRPKKTTPLPPLKVRQEPPTLDEAIIAARCLADDEDQIAEIAAGLMGVTHPGGEDQDRRVAAPDADLRRDHGGIGAGRRHVRRRTPTFDREAGVRRGRAAADGEAALTGLPVGDPARLGFCPDRLGRIAGWMDGYVDSGRLPGMLTVVMRGGEIAGCAPAGSPMSSGNDRCARTPSSASTR